jgi:hypothetical protein
MDGPVEVCPEHVRWSTRDTGKHGRFCTALDDKIDPPNSFQVFHSADVAVDEFDSCRLEARQVQLRAAPFEIVQCNDADVITVSPQSNRQRGANKTSTARYQNAAHNIKP